MKRTNFRKASSAVLLISGGPILATNAFAQSPGGYGPSMMDGYGYGWMWFPILVGFVAVGIVAWMVSQKRK